MSNSRKSWQWYWIPSALLLIGIILLLTLFGVGRIIERQGVNSTLVDALLHIQISAVTYHLRIDETLAGETSVDMSGAVAGMDRAVALTGMILDGGLDPGYGLLLQPLKVPSRRARANELKALLVDFKGTGQQYLHHSALSGIESIIEYRFHALFREILTRAEELELAFAADRGGNRSKAQNLILSALLTWTVVMLITIAGLWRLEARRKNAVGSMLKAHEELLSQAAELKEHRENLAGLVDERTAELTAANELLQAEIAEREQAEAALKESDRQLKYLSSRLLDAQEMERRRISMELHDELGQALNVIKLRIRIIEKGLGQDQAALRDDCEQLLSYMDHVIEDVRRLSRNLSPTVLEYLGLTSAIEWLVSNFARVQNMNIDCDIAEIDDLFPESHRVTIYRVAQEALTNIGKHARAKNATIVIQLDDGKVNFSIADTGQGFDPEQVSMKDASEKGFGLTTMQERVRMMGGVFKLWSRKGEGVRITFSIPIDKENI